MSDIQPGQYTATAQKIFLETTSGGTPLIRILADVLGTNIRVPVWLPNPEKQDERKLQVTARIACESLEVLGLDPDTLMSAVAEDPDIIAGAEFPVDIDYNEKGQMDCRIVLQQRSTPIPTGVSATIQNILSSAKKK